MENPDNYHRRLNMSPLLVGVLGIMAGAVVVGICHCITVFCNDMRTQGLDTADIVSSNLRENASMMPSDTVGHSTVQVIVASEYSKECKEDLCAVCLGEFKAGEGVRVLPECMHTFHVACIDKWLDGHSNCPLCRARAILA